jgi:hypothetical protein
VFPIPGQLTSPQATVFLTRVQTKPALTNDTTIHSEPELAAV